ncbi:MAG: hypothetical protein HY356_02740 [Gammaproteobacteria bacterium]|nr:hypothetical protein [Gammaproteobacteria bacterium]
MKEPLYQLASLLGSVRAITLEVTGIFLVTLFDLMVPGTKHHVFSVAAVLVLLAATFVSLALYRKHVRRTILSGQIAKFAEELEDRVFEILQTAVIEQWPTTDERTLCQRERQNKEVWVLAGDFKADLGSRRGAIIQNLSEAKKYRYICHHQAEKDMDTLWHTCERNVQGFKADRLEMRCLPERRLPPVQMLVFLPERSVHLILQKVLANRVLEVTDEHLRDDAMTAFNTLWEDLAKLSHGSEERFTHG